MLVNPSIKCKIISSYNKNKKKFVIYTITSILGVILVSIFLRTYEFFD